MRLWLRDSERRPDPVPAETDDRKAVLVGLGLWAIALVVVLVFGRQLADAGDGWWLWTIAIGLVLGLVGLVYLSVKRR
jgi:formate hydrogenlyase subunit 3/multisubunit Na+/H+ antiporter MnhD subunit